MREVGQKQGVVKHEQRNQGPLLARVNNINYVQDKPSVEQFINMNRGIKAPSPPC